MAIQRLDLATLLYSVSMTRRLIVDLTDTSLSRIAERLSMDVCSLCFSKHLAIIVRVL